jgi:hypothetical protein
VSDEEREQGRRDVHSGKVKFLDLLHKWGAEPDVEGLIPFTRWITPENVPKRFSAQMYLYFLPLPSSSSPTSSVPGVKGKAEEDEIVIPSPTHDGGIEHTAARFLPANKWLALFLTYLLSPFLAPTVTGPESPIPDVETLRREREALLVFLNQEREYQGEKEVSFAEACISPVVLGRGEYGDKGQDGVGGVGRDTAVLVLDKPGNEVNG